MERKKAILSLVREEEKIILPNKTLHIGWCVVDPKTVEKILPSLNELGVSKITFIYCDYSQKNFKPNLQRLEKILVNSSQQCGRSALMELDICGSIVEFMDNYPQSYVLDFCKKSIDDVPAEEISTLLVGCEGGFSQEEREGFDNEKVVGFSSNLILRSETALLGAASKILI